MARRSGTPVLRGRGFAGEGRGGCPARGRSRRSARCGPAVPPIAWPRERHSTTAGELRARQDYLLALAFFAASASSCDFFLLPATHPSVRATPEVLSSVHPCVTPAASRLPLRPRSKPWALALSSFSF